LKTSEKTKNIINMNSYRLIARSENKKGQLPQNLKNIKTVDRQLKACLKKDSFKATEKLRSQKTLLTNIYSIQYQ
jgi:hypothetical protein